MDLKLIRDKLVGSEEQRAVSPVIGVILMVAITVILAAVIATFVLDMGNNMGGEPVNAGVDIDGDGSSSVDVTLSNMANADGVAVLNASGDVNATLTASGMTENFSTQGNYTAHAYKADGSITNGDTLDDQVADSSQIAEFEVTS